MCSAVYFHDFLTSHFKLFAVKYSHHQRACLHLPKYLKVKYLIKKLLRCIIFKPAVKWTAVIADCLLFTSCTLQNPTHLTLHGKLAFLQYPSSNFTYFSIIKEKTSTSLYRWQSSPQEAWDTGVTAASTSQIPEEWCNHISSSLLVK